MTSKRGFVSEINLLHDNSPLILADLCRTEQDPYDVYVSAVGHSMDTIASLCLLDRKPLPRSFAEYQGDQVHDHESFVMMHMCTIVDHCKGNYDARLEFVIRPSSDNGYSVFYRVRHATNL
ncbi:MAG TPA: hypothetical protein VJC07_04585 [Candidatus Nanoarchaeia archaeon]|nr:hypothetical protein [Candidatus Nanoarchaeia archaeon]